MGIPSERVNNGAKGKTNIERKTGKFNEWFGKQMDRNTSEIYNALSEWRKGFAMEPLYFSF